MAASTKGGAPLPPSTPTVSESPTTLDTVTELLPYHKQFNAAGLAVTSREQMPRIPESAYPKLPARHAGRARVPNVVVVQIDGSTVTPSDKESVVQEPMAPAVPEKRVTNSSKSKSTAQAPQSEKKPANKSLLPWFLKKDPSLAATGHSGRKFSKDHMHPSQATPAEPLLTPLGFIDSYFDSPEPTRPPDDQPIHQSTSLSPAVSSTVSSHTDKPLPEQPPIMRRPVPPRSERRHMENTAEWPTAGILIHDSCPPPPDRIESAGFADEGPPPTKEPGSVHSWTTVEDDFSGDCQESPPVPPKETYDTTSVLAEVEDKPETPPKDDPPKKPEAQQGHRHHPGHSLYKKWKKATGMRHRASDKTLPMLATIGEKSETLPKHPEDPQQSAASPNDAAPRLPVDYPFPVECSSSFEKALDAVISKLDAMEERRRYERKMDLEAARQALSTSESPAKVTSKLANRKPSSSPASEYLVQAAALEATPSPEAAIELSDKDINDRDILLGLKMAICAACDEDLDAWICSKTGLRLRRFLADLKAFDLVSQERKQSQLLPMSRQIRRSDKENRRLQVEQDRRKPNTKLWSPCFGADGQGSVVETDEEALQDLPTK